MRGRNISGEYQPGGGIQGLPIRWATWVSQGPTSSMAPPQSASPQLWAPQPPHVPATPGSPRPIQPWSLPRTLEGRGAPEKKKGPHGFHRAGAIAPYPAAGLGQGPSHPQSPGSASLGRRGPWNLGRDLFQNQQETGVLDSWGGGA